MPPTKAKPRAKPAKLGNWKRDELNWGKWLHSKKATLPEQLRNPSQGVEFEDLGLPDDWWSGEHKTSHACPAWLRDAIGQVRSNAARLPGRLPFGMVTIQPGLGHKAVRLLWLEVDFDSDDPEDAMLALLATKTELESADGS